MVQDDYIMIDDYCDEEIKILIHEKIRKSFNLTSSRYFDQGITNDQGIDL